MGDRMRLLRLFALTSSAALATAACEIRSVPPPGASLPAWLRQEVSDGGQFPPVIEQVTYDGQLAYHTVATNRFDAGDEHSLFSADGKLICRFGGYAGQVTSGSCELDNIVYVRTLYDPD